VKTGCWVGDCFIYTNTANRLNYLVGGLSSTLAHFDKNMYLLGYIPRDHRIYLTDKDLAVFSYSLPLSLIEYQTAVLRGDFATAEKILPTVPMDQRNRIARFLESQGLKEQALVVSTDVEHRFDLAIQLDKLDVAYQIAKEVDREEKWKTVGDCALKSWKFQMAEECLKRAKDHEGLLLMYQASGNAKGLSELAAMAVDKGKNNIAFMSYLLRGDVENCIELLCATERYPEAALMARTYLPSQITKVVTLWRDHLLKLNKPKAASALADPSEYEDLFPDLKYALVAEEAFRRRRDKGGVPAGEYGQWKD
ncbi:Coatomer subunit beta', partial [Quaeritorhiza haematococci]